MPDAALDAAAAALTRQILRDAPADADRTRADVDRLAAPVAHLLHAWLDARADRLAAPPETAWLDAGHAALDDAAPAWQDAVRAAVRYPAAAWAEAVGRAARLALGHLVRPAETLAAYAFDDEDDPLPAVRALRRLRAFGPYPYLPDIAGRYVDQKGIDRVDRAELELLLQRIDGRMTRNFGPDEWMTLLEPVYALVGPLGSPPGTVPADLLRTLLHARGADALADALGTDDALAPDVLRQRLAGVLLDVETPPAPRRDVESTLEDTSEPAAPVAAEEPAEPETADSTLAPAAVPDEPAGPLADDARADEPLPDGAPLDRVTADDAPADDAPAAAAAQDEAPEPLADAVPADEAPADEPPSDRDAAEEEPVEPLTGRATLIFADQEEEPVAERVEREPTEPAAALGAAATLAPAEPRQPAPEPVASAEPSAVAPAEVADFDLPPTPEDQPAAPAVPLAEAAPKPPPGDSDDEEEPLWQRLARQRGTVDEEPPPPAEADAAPLWMRFAQPADAAPAPKSAAPTRRAEAGPPDADASALGALERRVLGLSADERRAWFVDELFGGSEDDYRQTLDALDGAGTWTAATQIIARDVFRKHRVNIYSEPAVAFTDAVEAQMAARR